MALRYSVDKRLRAWIMRVMSWITKASPESRVDWRRQEIKKVLLVRAIFRMGDAILATPAVAILRKNFPGARIDFVGAGISRALLEQLPVDHHYQIYRSFPKVCWSYIALLRRIRAVKYDLAVDVSGSSAALGSFIVGFSGARRRAGLRGRWDRWFNLRCSRPAEKNKYYNLPRLLGSMGLQTHRVFPRVAFSDDERAAGRDQLARSVDPARGPIVGIFVGGRKSRGKRWPAEHFVDIAAGLRNLGAQPVIFVGPEERELVGCFTDTPVVFEPEVRRFAALVAGCALFVTCDSGPMHLACAIGVRTVAIFLKNNFDRWGPPPELARIVYDSTGPTVQDVLEACASELSWIGREQIRRETVNA